MVSAAEGGLVQRSIAFGRTLIGVDRVDLARQQGVLRLRRWRNGGARSSGVLFVECGRLADSRWYAYRTGDPDGAYVYGADSRGLRFARRMAQRLMGELGGVWIPTPASFDAKGQPLDTSGWVERGGEWFPASPTDD